MFVAVYRWRIRPDAEEAFRASWRRITEIIVERCGSGGSHLFRDGDGTLVAIALWPSREARERCFATAPFDAAAGAIMRASTLETFDDLELDSLDDLWVARKAGL
ncbi:MAG: hypothetical protein NVSMB21_25450 [Vulcanimicrobiaceae bacterium]